MCFTYKRRAPNAGKYNFIPVFCKGFKDVTGLSMHATAPNNHSESWLKPQCETRPRGK